MGPDDKDAAPFCFIPSHPELLCNLPSHPDFPGYMTEGDSPTVPYCNVPKHPNATPTPVPSRVVSPIPSEPDLPSQRSVPPVERASPEPYSPKRFEPDEPIYKTPESVVCNIAYHPDYPLLIGTSSPLSQPVCTVASHPALLCNVPRHPDFPDHVGELGLNSPPRCNIPGHPQLLCNIRNHPDYPRLAGEAPAEPYCNVPSHPLSTKPKMYQPGGTGSPLPARRQGTPDAGTQAPPKKLEELMASFSGPSVNMSIHSNLKESNRVLTFSFLRRSR